MGWAAGRKLRRAIDGLQRVLAIELLTASRALELRAPLTPSPAHSAVIEGLHELGWAGPGADRWLAPEIEIAVQYVSSGTPITLAETALAQPLL